MGPKGFIVKTSASTVDGADDGVAIRRCAAYMRFNIDHSQMYPEKKKRKIFIERKPVTQVPGRV